MSEDHCEYEHSHPENIARKHGAVIQCEDCPVEWEVLMNEYTGEFELVRTEVTQPSSWYQHPLAKGAAFLTVALLAMFGPIAGGAYLTSHTVGFYGHYESGQLVSLAFLIGISSFAVSWILIGLLERHTPINEWIWAFDRWTETRARR